MSKGKEDPILALSSSPLRSVLVKGFAEVYRTKPDFPVQFLANWLKQYSRNQARESILESSRQSKQKQIEEMEQNIAAEKQKAQEEIRLKQLQIKKAEQKFEEKVNQTSYLQDLLPSELPEAIMSICHEKGTKITGCYVGHLTYRHKRLEEHNFETGAELDTESPKIIEYVGASKSHLFMKGEVLPNQAGRSYEVFKEEEPVQEAEEGKPVVQKHKYLYVAQVQRDEKMHFFRFPRLGSFACFPLKVKGCLIGDSFDKGISDYKSFVKNKEQVQKQHDEKLNQARGLYQQARRKYQEHQCNEQDANSVSDHAALKQQSDRTESVYRQIKENPPVIESFKYDTKTKEYVVSIDTMGQDSEITLDVMNIIEQKVEFFGRTWEDKQYKMLLDDIHQFIEDEPTLDSQAGYFRDQQQSIIAANESQIKQQHPNREKQAEFQLTVLKVRKLQKVLNEQSFQNSLQSYLSYHIHKFKQVVQILLMLLGYSKQKINLTRTNSLDARKCLTKQFIEEMIKKIGQYQLRRQYSGTVDGQYKINKLLQRLEKVDAEAVAKYNSWLFGALILAKNMCWARIQCRDAKIQAHEARTKAVNERDAEIAKYEQEMEKAVETAKAEVTEDSPPFVEDDFRKTYLAENPKPQKLYVDELKQFLDIE